MVVKNDGSSKNGGKMKTHQLIAEKDHIAVLGNGNYFSWHIEIEDNEFVVSSIFGKHYGSHGTLRQALESIEYGFDSRR